MSADESKVKYPTITVPGKGTFVVKFGMGAVYTLERDMKMDLASVGRELQAMFPIVNGHVTAGPVKMSFLFDVLSACIWDQKPIGPRDLADAFGNDYVMDMVSVGRVVLEAFSKAPWSRKTASPDATETDIPESVAAPI